MLKALIKRSIRSLGIEVVRAQRRRQTSAEIQASLFPDASMVFDVGAYLGETVKEYRALFPYAEIYAFEPFPKSFAALERALPGDNRFHPLNLALAETAGQLSFYSNKSAATNSLLPVAPEAAKFWGVMVEPRDAITVPVSTIDTVCAAYEITCIDILKMDVQGAELRVLRGAKSLLSANNIKMVYLEVIIAPTYEGQQSFEQILQFMRQSRYQLYDIQNLSHADDRLIVFDALFIIA